MKIAGFVKNSFVDYPGIISAVVFTQGCNFHCEYCHNPELRDRKAAGSGIAVSEILEWLEKRKGLVRATVIGGGEPTLQRDLDVFLRDLKALDLHVKLDTNGSRPRVLQNLLDGNLLDFIAMDLKAPLRKYGQIAAVRSPDLYAVRESARIIRSCGRAYEFRTTLCPGLTAEDIAEIISDFDVRSGYVVQKCRSTPCMKVSGDDGVLSELMELKGRGLTFSLRGFGSECVKTAIPAAGDRPGAGDGRP